MIPILIFQFISILIIGLAFRMVAQDLGKQGERQLKAKEYYRLERIRNGLEDGDNK